MMLRTRAWLRAMRAAINKLYEKAGMEEPDWAALVATQTQNILTREEDIAEIEKGL